MRENTPSQQDKGSVQIQQFKCHLFQGAFTAPHRVKSMPLPPSLFSLQLHSIQP